VNAIAPALAALAAEIAPLSAALGHRVMVDVDRVADRRDELTLGAPGLWSPNRACRLVRAADGWIAVNLAREDDAALVPAWLRRDVWTDPWALIVETARTRPWRDLAADARLLGLPAAGVGEVQAATPGSPLLVMAAGESAGRQRAPRVIDLSSLWAGPLCGAILARMGAEVVKVESLERPDPVRHATPALFERLNGGKSARQIPFSRADAVARLRDDIAAADVVITSARPRAFEQLGLAPAEMFAANPGLVWVAVTGYGWTGDGADRVAFGDDAAAAGGLVRWTPGGAPRFLGDALADPLTGLSAAAGALRGLIQGGGVLVDAALARCAAGAAAMRAPIAAAA
jgi:hypothetical protein